MMIRDFGAVLRYHERYPFRHKRGQARREPPVVCSTMQMMPCEVYSRIVDYLRPLQNWHAGKKQEFKDRRTYDISGV